MSRAENNRAADNVEIVRKGLTDLDALADLLAEDLIWHFYGGVDGIPVDTQGRDNVFSNVWGKLFEISSGTFAVEPVTISGAGNELVVAHVSVNMGLDTGALDAVVVYRVVDGQITEGWDIPSTPI